MPDRTDLTSGTGRPFKVLIVRIGAMGDVLHAMPAVAAMRKLHEDWEIKWAIEPRWSELLQAGGAARRVPVIQPITAMTPATPTNVRMPLVNGLHSVTTREWKQHPFSRATLESLSQLRRNLSSEHFDLCIDMQGAIRSAAVGRLAGAKRYVGMSNPREPLARYCYKERVAITSAHVVEQGCELLGSAIGETLRPCRLTLPQDEEAEAWCDRKLAEPSNSAPFIFLAPTAGWGAKQWPPERYGELAIVLGGAGYRVLVNAVGQGDRTAEAVVAASNGVAQAIPCSVGQMIALTRRAALVVAGDSGPLHLAAALERPLIGIYGPTDPRRTGPFGVGHVTQGRVLRDPASSTSHARIAEAEHGILKITVDDVWQAARSVLHLQ